MGMGIPISMGMGTRFYHKKTHLNLHRNSPLESSWVFLFPRQLWDSINTGYYRSNLGRPDASWEQAPSAECCTSNNYQIWHGYGNSQFPLPIGNGKQFSLVESHMGIHMEIYMRIHMGIYLGINMVIPTEILWKCEWKFHPHSSLDIFPWNA